MRFDILKHLHRATTRSRVSPTDKTTIFSIFPREIVVDKITLDPQRYVIPAGSPEEPSRLVVGSASWWMDVDPDQPLIEKVENSYNVAESIVNDYINSAYPTAPDCKMGLFFVEGDVTVPIMKEKHKDLYHTAITRQNNWYARLLEMADIGWARSNGSPLAINDDMRLAAKILKRDKEWLRQDNYDNMVTCISCGALRNPKYPTCTKCNRIVDQELAKKLGLVA